jgi:hypothetical protein
VAVAQPNAEADLAALRASSRHSSAEPLSVAHRRSVDSCTVFCAVANADTRSVADSDGDPHGGSVDSSSVVCAVAFADAQAIGFAVGVADISADNPAAKLRTLSRSDGDPHGGSVGAADGCAEREAELDADRRSEDRHADGIADGRADGRANEYSKPGADDESDGRADEHAGVQLAAADAHAEHAADDCADGTTDAQPISAVDAPADVSEPHACTVGRAQFHADDAAIFGSDSDAIYADSDGDPHGSSLGAADGCAEREAELDADRRSEYCHADSDTGTYLRTVAIADGYSDGQPDDKAADFGRAVVCADAYADAHAERAADGHAYDVSDARSLCRAKRDANNAAVVVSHRHPDCISLRTADDALTDDRCAHADALRFADTRSVADSDGDPHGSSVGAADGCAECEAELDADRRSDAARHAVAAAHTNADDTDAAADDNADEDADDASLWRADDVETVLGADPIADAHAEHAPERIAFGIADGDADGGSNEHTDAQSLKSVDGADATADDGMHARMRARCSTHAQTAPNDTHAHSHTGFDALHGPAIRGELSHPDHDRLACALANGRSIPRADTYAFSRPDCGADDAAIGCSIGDAYLLTIAALDLCADAHAHWRAHPFTIVSDLYTRPNRPADAVSEPHARAIGRPQCHADDAAIFGSDSDAVYAAVAQAHAYADRTSVRRADSSAHADPDGSAHARSVAVPHAAPHGTTFGAADGCADPETDSDTHGRADTPEVHHAYCAVVDVDANERAIGHP